jgi:prepilin peptidase CpaA
LVQASDLIVLAALSAGLGTAAVIDIRHRRIPNVVCVSTAAAGLLLATVGVNSITVTSALAGLAYGFVMMLPGHVFGATGAGDVKLFAAAGTMLGSGRVVRAFLFVAIAGGVLAVVIALRRGRLGRTVGMAAQLLGRPTKLKSAIESPAEHNRFSYGPAIAIGCVVAMLIGDSV